MEALDMVATDVVVAKKPVVLDLGAVAQAPADEPSVVRWPGWLRLAILLGGAGGLWLGIGWAVVRLMKLG